MSQERPAGAFSSPLVAGLLLGLLVAAVAALTIAAGPAEVGGRYALYFSPHARADTYLLDSETGKLWAPVQYTDLEGQPTVWKYQDRVDNYDELRAWVAWRMPPDSTP